MPDRCNVSSVLLESQRETDRKVSSLREELLNSLLIKPLPRATTCTCEFYSIDQICEEAEARERMNLILIKLDLLLMTGMRRGSHAVNIAGSGSF